MVDFRYHIVSIVAVFLALGTGIILGTTTLPRLVIDDLDRNVRRLSRDKQERTDRIRELERDLADDRAFAAAVLPLLVEGHLVGRNVLVVSAPGTGKDLREGIADVLTRAGATVTGQVRLTAELVKPERAAELDDLVDTLLPPGVTLTGSSPAQRAAAELAAVLAVRTAGAPPPTTPPAATTRVLSGLAENGFVAVDGPTTAVVPAPLVLVLLPAGPDRRTPAPTPSTAQPDPVLAFVTAVAARAQGVVLAAPTGTPDAPLAAARTDPLLSDRVSSVDGVDTATGRIATVLALGNELAGEHGHFGTGDGAEAPVPSPVPAARP